MQATDTEIIIGKAAAGTRISVGEAILLWDKAPLWTLARIAVERKKQFSGDRVFYNRNIHIEPTNICKFDCSFCSYHRNKGEQGSWEMSLEDILKKAESYKYTGITEIHIVGGVHPDRDILYYIDLIKGIKQILPNVIIKAFTAVELAFMIDKAGLAIEEGLTRLRDAGMEALPGGGAEIFDPEVRATVCPDKGSAELWLEVHRTAHSLGMTSNATMLYGHIETVSHRFEHMERLRGLQDNTGGFNAFIPLKYRCSGNRLSHLGETSVIEDMKTIAMSRIFLDNFPHIKAYWPMLGKTSTETALLFGADDIDGTIDDTTKIYSMAGAEDHPKMTPEEVDNMARAAGFTAVERDTFYNPVEKI